jgi:hypothetical protein
MAVSLPYLPSNKNVEALFAKIQSAKIPDKFTHDFLKTTIGLKGSGDRALIPLMRTLGFLDQTGAPTAAYRLLKNGDSAKAALGKAVRKAYAPLFESNEDANRLASDKLKGLIAQVAGTDDDMTARIAWTFGALAKVASFDAIAEEEESEETPVVDEEADDRLSSPRASPRDAPRGLEDNGGGKGLQPSFHYNIQVHLPSNGSEGDYLNIFNALRKAFQ